MIEFTQLDQQTRDSINFFKIKCVKIFIAVIFVVFLVDIYKVINPSHNTNKEWLYDERIKSFWDDLGLVYIIDILKKKNHYNH